MTSEQQTKRYKLSDGVYFRRVGDDVYVRNVRTRHEYLMNSFAADVLECLRTEVSTSDLVKELEKSHPTEDPNNFKGVVSAFVEQLVEKELVDVQSLRGRNAPKQGIRDKVRDYCSKNHKLWYVCLELTYRCNERCRHCYIDDPKQQCARDEMSKEDWFRVVDELAEVGCGEILVTGGEPTLRPDFIDICKRVTQRGMLLNVFTNALNISDAIFDELVGLHPNSVSFSLYGGHAEFHDYITQVPGSFDRTLMNILKFKSAGVDVFVKSVQFKDHFDEYVALRDLGKRFNLIVTHSTIIAPGNSGKSNCDMMLSESDMAKLYQMEKAQRGWQIDRSKLKRDFDGPICSAGQLSLSVRPNGEVLPCNALPIRVGDVKQSSIKEIWTKSEKLKEVQSIRFADFDEKCRSCPHAAVCVACLGAVYKENGGVIKPCSYVCRNARLRYENEF